MTFLWHPQLLNHFPSVIIPFSVHLGCSINEPTGIISVNLGHTGKKIWTTYIWQASTMVISLWTKMGDSEEVNGPQMHLREGLKFSNLNLMRFIMFVWKTPEICGVIPNYAFFLDCTKDRTKSLSSTSRQFRGRLVLHAWEWVLFKWLYS